MTPEIFFGGKVTLHAGDSRSVLQTLADDCIDSIVTDPPYALVANTKRYSSPTAKPCGAGTDGSFRRLTKGFMGKAWDTGETAFAATFWAECLRVLKPGGHVVAFSGTRTYHRMACAIEDAGFEVRDMLSWLYGSGFPKSHSVGKTIHPVLQERYGKQECNCLDCGDGRAARLHVGPSDRQDVRFQRTSSNEASENSRHIVVPIDDGGETAVRDMRETDPAQAAGSPAIEETVLLQDVRELRSEAPRHGHASLWTGMEERQGTGSGEGQELPVLRQNARTKQSRSPRPPSEAISVRRDEQSEEPRGSLRGMSPPDRIGNRTSIIVDPDRCSARHVIPDNQSGWQTTVAHVCSWCGLPDKEWADHVRQLGTALKPAVEPILLGRKPLIGTVAANVLAHGTGAINVDGCRVGTNGEDRAARYGGKPSLGSHGVVSIAGQRTEVWDAPEGRWPANVLHDGSDEVLAGFPEAGGGFGKRGGNKTSTSYGFEVGSMETVGYGDEGSAARFFYTSKADSDDRLGSRHPTVKPVDLMQWLCRLVTPPGGTVLDPFSGTGTTGEAAFREGFNAVLVEREDEYLNDIRRRMRLVMAGPDERARESIKARQGDALPDHGPLFGGVGCPPRQGQI